MGFEPFGIHADQQRERGAGGMAADEDLARVAALFGDMLHRPGEGRGGVIDVSRVFRLRAQTVVGRHDGDAGLGEALADLRAVFRTEVLAAVLHSSAVEPDVGREALGADRYGQVELAALLFVRRQRDHVVLIRDVLDDLRLERRDRRYGEGEQQGQEAHQAMSGWTILPCTSVRRKSRPELRKVNSSWLKPRRRRIVACRSCTWTTSLTDL